MGAGFHGGFGLTSGVNYRIGTPVDPIKKNIDMSLSPVYYCYIVANKYNIHLRGSGKRIDIEFDPNLKSGQYGKTKKNNPYVIYIGRDALSNEEQLANTIAHELRHAREFIKFGTSSERESYKSGDSLAAYIRGEK